MRVFSWDSNPAIDSAFCRQSDARANASWLDATGAPIGVQQKLMRHAHVSTTMNVYGNALMESKREANSKIVQLVLGQRTVDADEETGHQRCARHTLTP